MLYQLHLITLERRGLLCVHSGSAVVVIWFWVTANTEEAPAHTAARLGQLRTLCGFCAGLNALVVVFGPQMVVLR